MVTAVAPSYPSATVVSPLSPSGASSLDAAARRLAALLLGTDADELTEAGTQLLEFEQVIAAVPLPLGVPPCEVWAVDGGQALAADARCLSVVATRASSVRFADRRCLDEEVGPLRVTLLGGEAQRLAAYATLREAEFGIEGVAPDSAIDANLLRDLGEWEAVHRCVKRAAPGALVLVDGDLQPDWRLPRSMVTALLRSAREREVTVVGVTKHTALARGGAPLLAQLEREAENAFGRSARWWSSIGRTRADGGEVRVVAARLDPDARFCFRIDLPATADPVAALGALATVCDDAGFPGYPYPLTVADRLAAVPGWERAELRLRLDELLHASGVPDDVVERAFADRHRLMERA